LLRAGPLVKCWHKNGVTSLLEQKENIRVIQVLLGHEKLETVLYGEIATRIPREVTSPLENLRL
jgi:integrase/recombinase XerD